MRSLRPQVYPMEQVYSKHSLKLECNYLSVVSYELPICGATHHIGLNNLFTRAAGGRAPTHSESCRKGVVSMSTYEEFQLIISVTLLIIAILNYSKNDHRK